MPIGIPTFKEISISLKNDVAIWQSQTLKKVLLQLAVFRSLLVLVLPLDQGHSTVHSILLHLKTLTLIFMNSLKLTRQKLQKSFRMMKTTISIYYGGL